MHRFALRTFGARMALLTTLVSVVAAIVPLVALAGSGDPRVLSRVTLPREAVPRDGRPRRRSFPAVELARGVERLRCTAGCPSRVEHVCERDRVAARRLSASVSSANATASRPQSASS